jgi:hypothetical protein
MFCFLGFADGYPMMNPVKKIHSPGMSCDSSHDSALQMTAMPAGGLEGGHEVSSHASLTRLPMVQKKAIHASKAVIMKVLHDRNTQFKG